MIKRFKYPTCLTVIILLFVGMSFQKGTAQSTDTLVQGQVFESGSGLPLKQVLISVSSTGVSAETDSSGAFTIGVPDKNVQLIIDLPGYNRRRIYLNGRDHVDVSLVSSEYKSLDNNYYSPLGHPVLKDATYAVSVLKNSEFEMSKSTSFDQNMQGRIAGMHVVEHSGMPGTRTWMNIRGISSLYGKNMPLLYVDGMIHDYEYTNISLMEGFALNPVDVIDIEEITDIAVLKNGVSYLGGASSNGVIYINTEQESETSTTINISAYTGLSMIPASQDVLKANEYRNYLNQRLAEEGLNASQIDAKFPWLNGTLYSPDYYKYNNSTDWQKEIFETGTLNKAHLFIKGGDDIATYNISTGYVKQNTIYEESRFSRFNLRINGKVNITDKFSVAPNAKLSLADTYLPNQGPSKFKNPILSALTMPPITTVNARDPQTGIELPFLDDVGEINVSNPVAIIRNAQGTSRNYNFLSSVNMEYKVSSRLLISSLTGIGFNNTRESIFLPDLGLAQVDSAYNSPGDFTSEYRSTQNHTTVSYNTRVGSGHSVMANAGLKYVKNTYKNVKLIDLNTASDDFKDVGAGTGTLTYLRTSTGDDRGLLWLSFFGDFNYNYLDKYFVNANISYEGNSATAEKNRYNFYPSVGVAWRLSSENFLLQSNWIEDLKLRASWSQSGNIFSNAYDYSKLYYKESRLADISVIEREAIPNEDMEIEKKNTINAGLDISLFKQTTNVHIDYYIINVNNLVIEQTLPVSYGFTRYYNNGGKLKNTGVEIAADQRFQFGLVRWTIGASMAKQTNEITGLDFVNPDQKNIVTRVEGAEYVTSEGNAVNAFYGYKTNGIYTDNAEASQITGPEGSSMQAGDIRFVDADGNMFINEADKTIIGDPNPDFFGSISTSLSYKRIGLSAFFTYSVGNDAFNYVRYVTESMDTYGNQLTSVLNRYGSGNQNNVMPRASYGDPTGNSVFSDRWIEDASYLRLKQLTLHYTLPGTRYYKGLKLFLTAHNVFTLTEYSGYDPEFMYMNNPFYMGIDYGSIPKTRSFILGIKLAL
ncbi:MAG: SusC/RagA family TonB-linked outer membrane protein [Bacteroidales bacterium]|nr:SusC/RagA family TonB-linked outer membrane protein [Bacteroidales bacterium]MBN2762585.1 SusC/RagA family TonB-linked outer membrane protein [Bacteroidales bacterium]